MFKEIEKPLLRKNLLLPLDSLGFAGVQLVLGTKQ